MQTHTPRRPGKPFKAARAFSRGFSMLELVIVVVVVGVVAALAVPRYAAARSQYRVQGAAQRVMADYLGLRRRAMAESGSARLLAEEGRSVYLLQCRSRDAQFNDVTNSQRVDLGSEPYVASIMKVTQSTGSDLGFDAYGAVLGTGALTLRSVWTACTVSFDSAGGAAAGAPKSLTQVQRSEIRSEGVH